MTRPATSSAATVEIYRKNIFRVIGLPVDATSRMVRRRCEQVRIAHELPGPAPSSGGRLQLDPPPDQDAFHRAAAAWEDPEQRLVDELFWFWGPDTAAGNTAQPSSLDQAVAAVHDRAVEAHCVALDLEFLAQRQALTPGERQRLTQSWADAARHWADVINDPKIWAHLERRVAEIGDPRLTSHTVAELKQTVPARWLAINARLALDAVESSDVEVKLHRQLMRDFARTARLDDDAVDRALQLVAEPAIRRIEDACGDARSAADDDPEIADEIAADLQERLRQPLTVVDRLLTLEHPAARRAHDRVASALRQCAVEYFNAVGFPALQQGGPALAVLEITTAVRLLGEATELASTPGTRVELARDIAYFHSLIGPVPSSSRPVRYGGSRTVVHLVVWGLLAIATGIGLLIAGVASFGGLVIMIGIGLFAAAARENSTRG